MVRHRHIAAVVATAALLTPGLASIASAYPAPLGQAEATVAATQNSALVRPNPDQQTGTRPAAPQGPCSEVCSGGVATHGQVSQTSTAPQLSVPALLRSGTVTAPTTAAAPQTVVRVVASHNGFDWGDAGIGAGVMLLVFGLAGTLVATNGRRSRTRKQRAVATS
jgi:hypothetical protein